LIKILFTTKRTNDTKTKRHSSTGFGAQTNSKIPHPRDVGF
jgi:hypothetical protein